MGGSQSTGLTDIEVEIERLCGAQKYALEDEFWNRLLSLPLQSDAATIEKTEAGFHLALDQYARKLVKNNPITGNLSTLLRVAAKELDDQPRDSEIASSATKFPLRLYNALVLIRVFLKHCIESLDAASLEGQFLDRKVYGIFTRALVEYSVTCGVWPASYFVHIEVLNVFLVAFSTQMVRTLGEQSNPFLDAFMEYKTRTGEFVTALMVHYVKQFRPLEPPKEFSFWETATSVLTSTATAFIWVPISTYSYFFYDSDPGAPLADRSLLLLLIVCNHYQIGERQNPFREALCNMRDIDLEVDDEAKAPAGGARISYSNLYQCLCRQLVDERSVLLFYFLLHGNEAFQSYILSRTDMDALMVPLMKLLYEAEDQKPHQVYMLLIVILILTQDAAFNKAVHKQICYNVPWFKERILSEISVGGLMVVVLVRTIQCNLARMRDVYLHTNCLAALANMSCYIDDLHSYPAQRLLSLFELLAKKYHKLVAKRSTANVTEVQATVDQEIATYSDFLHTVLEIMNGALTVLPDNPQVVYALLHRKELFNPFRVLPVFAELIENVDQVLEFFGKAAGDAETEVVSVEAVLANIVKLTEDWNPSCLKTFPELKFQYEEVPNPTEFFTPYVWSLVFRYCTVPWEPRAVRLFELKIYTDVEVEDSAPEDAADMQARAQEEATAPAPAPQEEEEEEEDARPPPPAGAPPAAGPAALDAATGAASGKKKKGKGKGKDKEKRKRRKKDKGDVPLDEADAI